MEKPLAVANYFIQKSIDTGGEITPMKLVKLVYLAHGWHLGLKEVPLISEPVEAWKYGPVVPSLYHEFKRYGNRKIESIELNEDYEIVVPDGDNEKFLDKIWEVYGKFSGVELSTITHQKGSPWYTIWEEENGKNYHGVEIPNDVIKYYYQQKVKANNG